MKKEVIVTSNNPQKEYYDVLDELHITIESNVNKNIILNYKGSKSKLKIDLFEAASLKLLIIGGQSLEITEEFFLSKDSNLEIVSFYNNENKIINTYVNLDGINSKVNSNSLSVVNGKNRVNRVININHKAKNSISNINEVGLVSNQGYLKVDGNVTINKDMKLSDSNQKLKGIMLSKEAVIEMNPSLIIDNYDVVAGHGAAIGAINSDMLFYLMSRGINKSTALKLIIKGTIDYLIRNLDDEDKNMFLLGVEKII